MVKAYLRYEAAASFGVIASLEGNITYDASGKFLLSPVLEKLAVWHVRQGTCLKTLTPSLPSSSSGPALAVTATASSPSSLVASGYANGSIRVWDPEKGSCESTFNGHEGAVAVLKYDKAGAYLASGGKDNDVILWDVVGEVGLFRLRGHRDQVTDLVFLESGKKLVSSSKDKFIRVWDLETQHCMQIVTGHHSQIWSLDVDPQERYLVAGSADQKLRVYAVKHELVDGHAAGEENASRSGDGAVTTQSKWQVLKLLGEIPRQVEDRVATVRFNKSGNLLACQVAGKTLDIYRILGEDEAKKNAKRRLHRKIKKKAAKVSADAAESKNNGLVPEGDASLVLVNDIFKLFHTVRASTKICSIAFSPNPSKNSLASIALSLNNNLLAFYSVKSHKISETSSIKIHGHRSDVRSVALSSDNSLLLSTSHNEIKFWNPSTGSCLRTIDSVSGSCGLILPYNKYALVGTKYGEIEIADIGSGTCIDKVKAHGGSIDTIVQIPDKNAFVTGSKDKDVKFWEFGIKQSPDQGSTHFLVSNVRTLKMNNDVVAVAVSPDAKYIAVSLLDSTVKVYFMDSLKFFLSLYGHNQQVLCMDISSDGDLIATGSKDKNLKIWGLDFGDCHKSIFAHSESIRAVKFVRNTHYLFSVGEDRLVKYWDTDKFELLLTLEGHHDSILCLAVSSLGDFVVTGSRDRSIRRWDRTEEPFFIEEEKERRVDQMFEADVDPSENRNLPKEELPWEGTAAVAGKKTQETLSATDLIIDALDVAEVELKRIAEHEVASGYADRSRRVWDVEKGSCEAAFNGHKGAVTVLKYDTAGAYPASGSKDNNVILRDVVGETGLFRFRGHCDQEKIPGRRAEFQPNVILRGLSPSDYVLHVLSSIQSKNLEQTLLALSFSDALTLLSHLKNWTCNFDKIELVCRIATLILQNHYNQLITSPAARPTLMALRDVLYPRVKECTDALGFNLAAMDHLKQMMASRSDAPFRDGKAKLLEIRAHQSKRMESSTETKGEKRKKKKQKKLDDGHAHAWI